MNDPRRQWLCWSGLGSVGLLLVAPCSAHALDARVRLGLEQPEAVWVGQQIGLTVDLLTNGQQFAGTRIRIPDIPGGLVLEDAVTTVRLSEQVAGETWQVLRYSYPMFLQRPGALEIPPVQVVFDASAGFGGERAAFDLTTGSVRLQVRRPPGITDLRQLVTSNDFQVEVTVTPDPVDLRVGDAFTRRVTRSASAVSGMAFAPLFHPEVPGVAVYPAAAEVDDSSNRGVLRGRRVDSATFVLQQAGVITIPGFELLAWNPQTEQLQRRAVPPLTLQVAANPAADVTASGPERQRSGNTALMLALVGLALGLLARWRHRVVEVLRRWRKARAQSESVRFKNFLRACASDDALAAYGAYRRWVAAFGPVAPGWLADPALAAERERVQQALVGSLSGWEGGTLASTARQLRSRDRRVYRAAGDEPLPRLNPL